MTEYTTSKCSECGQQLRIPVQIGGLLMACPACGHRFHSDFKLGSPGANRPPAGLALLFWLPDTIMRRLCRYFCR